MAQTGFFHHISTFLLFCATVLLIITCISAPVVHDLGILKVDVANQPASDHAYVAFGTFGWCTNGIGGEGTVCSPSQVGYSPTDVMNSVENTQFSQYASDTTRSLTKAMILHPIACGLNFIGFMLALGASTVGSFLASMVALLAFIVTCIIMIIDFVLFSIVKSNVHDDGSGSSAYYSAAAWTILVSAICSLIGCVVVFLTCCSARIHRRRRPASKLEGGYVPSPRRNRWF